MKSKHHIDIRIYSVFQHRVLQCFSGDKIQLDNWEITIATNAWLFSLRGKYGPVITGIRNVGHAQGEKTYLLILVEQETKK